jgi:hypothetical protein
MSSCCRMDRPRDLDRVCRTVTVEAEARRTRRRLIAGADACRHVEGRAPRLGQGKDELLVVWPEVDNGAAAIHRENPLQ